MKKYCFLSTIILLLAAILRFCRLGDGSLSGDESITIIRAYWIVMAFVTGNIRNFYGLVVSPRPPADIFSVLPSIVFGLTESRARFIGVTASLISLGVVMFGLRRLLPGKQILLFGFLLAVSPMIVGWSRLASADSLEMAMSGVLLILLIRKKTLPLLITYALSFLITETFVVIGPLVVWTVFRSITKKTFVIFLMIVTFIWLPRFIGSYYLPSSLGVNYQLAKMHLPNIFSNMRYYLSTYFIHPSVAPAVLIMIWGMIVPKVRKDRIYFFSTTYFLSYAFFFIFIFWKTQAYLGAAYIPLLLAASRAAFLLWNKKAVEIAHVLFGLILCGITVIYLMEGTSNSIPVWGFNKPTSIAKAAYLVRMCTSPDSKIIADVDGYASSLYFNRKYYQEQDKSGLEATLEKFASEAGAIYYTKALFINNFGKKVPINFNDGSVLYILPCSVTIKDFKTEDFYKKYWHMPNIINFYR